MVDRVHSGLTASIPGGDAASGAGRVAAVLNAAADLLEKPGAWTQGEMARDESGSGVEERDPKAQCWCVIGAVARATTDLTGWVSNTYVEARTTLALAVGTDADGGIPDWNDTPGRTQAEVVKALRHAALTVTPQDGAPA